MSETCHAEIDGDGTVLRVIVADAAFVATLPGEWVRTYPDGSEKCNYAGIGHKYDGQIDAFYSPRPFDSWELDPAKAMWMPPSAAPKDGKMYSWNEAKLMWEDALKG